MAPLRDRRWLLHAALLGAWAVVAALVAAADLGSPGGGFIDLTGLLAMLAGIGWGAYAVLSTALVAWTGNASARRTVALHAVALALTPVATAGVLAAMARLEAARAPPAAEVDPRRSGLRFVGRPHPHVDRPILVEVWSWSLEAGPGGAPGLEVRLKSWFDGTLEPVRLEAASDAGPALRGGAGPAVAVARDAVAVLRAPLERVGRGAPAYARLIVVATPRGEAPRRIELLCDEAPSLDEGEALHGLLPALR